MKSIEKKHKRIIKAIKDGLFERNSYWKMTERNGRYIQINTRDNTEAEFTQDRMIEMIEMIEVIEKYKAFEELTDFKTVAQSNTMRLKITNMKDVLIWQQANRLDCTINGLGNLFIKDIKNGNLALDDARYKIKGFIKFFKLNSKKSNSTEKFMEFANDMIIVLKSQLQKFDELGRTVTTDQKRANQNQTPTLKKETANVLFEILKIFFDKNQHSDLEKLLKNGTQPEQKLIFKNNANRLTDTFKQLFNNNLLMECNKEVLKNWLVANFQFVKMDIISDLKPNTVHKSISGRQYLCKNPIIEIKEGKIFLAKKV